MSETGIIVKVREMILSGEIPQGTRVTEAGLAEQLNISRTPVRNVLPALAKEGLLETVGRRGFAVKTFSLPDSLQALEIRAALEGLAAKALATNGMSKEIEETLIGCLERGDKLFEKKYLTPDDEMIYAEANETFHQTIIYGADSNILKEMYDRVKVVPFVAPKSLAFRQLGHEKAFPILFVAHAQHHAVFQAIKAKDPTRAEAVFREHAYSQRASMVTI